MRTVECLEGSVEMELLCEPLFDYGRVAAEWSLVDGGRHLADATASGQTIRLASDLALGIEGPASGRAMSFMRASGLTAPCPGPRSSPRRPTSTMRRRG